MSLICTGEWIPFLQVLQCFTTGVTNMYQIPYQLVPFQLKQNKIVKSCKTKT